MIVYPFEIQVSIYMEHEFWTSFHCNFFSSTLHTPIVINKPQETNSFFHFSSYRKSLINVMKI